MQVTTPAHARKTNYYLSDTVAKISELTFENG